MPALVDENKSYQDESGKPIVNGFIFVGPLNGDAVNNPIPIFEDRELTTSLNNPQRTDAFGKSAKKIWVPGRHSIIIHDENNSLIATFSDDDAGEEPAIGITSLTNITLMGGNITGQAVPGITAYVDKQQFALTMPGTSAGSLTLNVDNVGQFPITKFHDQAIEALDIEANQILVIAFNATDSTFEMISQLATQVSISPKMIIPFFGLETAIPSGFVVCDGNNGTPNLLNTFVKGTALADGMGFGTSGGSITTGSHTLLTTQIPAHTHTIPSSGSISVDQTGGQNAADNIASNTGSTGGGLGHTHPGNEPPFIRLLWIMKT